MRYKNGENVKRLALIVALAVAAVTLAPAAHAKDMNPGNYDIAWSRPWDFHTWLLTIWPCFTPDGQATVPGCMTVSANPMPIARAAQWRTVAHQENGRYSLTVDVPEGLLCGGYYGPSVPTRDTYSWDAVTLAGTLESAVPDGPCGPARTDAYPFSLIRM